VSLSGRLPQEQPTEKDTERFCLIKEGHLPWIEGRKRRTVSLNLHGVCRSARPASRWALKAHRMMGKTQWRHCERSFGTNVLVLGKQSRHLSLAVPTSKKDVYKKCCYRTSSKLENSVLEINHVMNVTTVLDETVASDRVSRSLHQGCTVSPDLFWLVLSPLLPVPSPPDLPCCRFYKNLFVATACSCYFRCPAWQTWACFLAFVQHACCHTGASR